MDFHDIPYAATSPYCRCKLQTCGGLTINPDCPDHGNKKNPAMERHTAGNERCQQLTKENTR
ncbi:hypothetical protein [Streptomyces achromogenes]|uniref:hypothetical protein n=1 Tax=Streptomyces achromogenes TaxID=67255 RepID=UPI003A800F22